MPETASSIDSYKKTLAAVLNGIKPEHVFEWGPGLSTVQLNDFPSVKTITSVESDREWLEKSKERNLYKVEYIFEEQMSEYRHVTGNYAPYDLIFIDGRDRENCLRTAKRILSNNGVVILHDAEREKYQNSIRQYKWAIWKDYGHTVVLTDNDKMHSDLKCRWIF